MVAARSVRTGLVVVDHGSRRAEANDVLLRVAEGLARRDPEAYCAVEPAHMEILAPSVADAVERCVAAGARHVIVVPFFLAPGRHSNDDIPRLAEEAVAAHAGVTVAVAEPLGADARLIEALLDRVRAVEV